MGVDGVGRVVGGIWVDVGGVEVGLDDILGVMMGSTMDT